MQTMKVPYEHAITELNRLRNEWSRSGRYPFLIGDDQDLESLRDLTEPPADHGEEILAQAENLDIADWLKQHAPARKAAWPKQTLPAQTGITSLHNALSGRPKQDIHLGLVEATSDWQVYARLGYGGWNGCPEPHVHVALHQYWDRKHNTSLLYLSGDTQELLVRQPCTSQSDALTLANEQYAYCDDIVEQGVGSRGKLASSLLNSSYWFFWWD